MGIKYWSLMFLLIVTVVCSIATAALFLIEIKSHSVSASYLGIGLIATTVLSTSCIWCQKYAKPPVMARRSNIR